MVMRVGGIASGMDIEAMVKKLMEAERIPLTRLEQKQTSLEWKRDSFREINNKLLNIENMMLDMRLSTTYKPKSATSTQSGTVLVTAGSSAGNGTYAIEVKKLATNAMNYSTEAVEADVEFTPGTYGFSTYNENGEAIPYELVVEEGDSLDRILTNIGKASDGTVRAVYDANSEKVILETTRTGIYNSKGSEITFESDFFVNELKMGAEIPAKNAVFTYNGLELTSKDNEYNINGLHLNFQDIGLSHVTVSTNVDQAYDTIKQFVDRYNEAIEVMNKSQTEERFRDFPPLTKEQEEEMTERQIEQWEEKAKSGILRGESVIQNGMYALRGGLQSTVSTDGAFQILSQIGITTTANYLDGGKLEINETKLKEALRDHPDDVYTLFTSDDPENPGLIHRFKTALDETRGNIEKRAGKSTHTLDNYSLGKEMKALDERIEIFQRKMVQVEDRYWRQFTQMEKAISRLNQQADYLYSQFSG